ncbi:thymidine kinase [Tanapox virus]|uniref:Thymidine kinase n=2 Tax=Tanapox virus TaxID=99000 RepID=A7XCI9_9POXV|nr:thymidine kinase [Yaba-like disease virus]ABQ43541.1 thymidine kinase [Tanapox virus]ABQ43696.1 thymidine kinase [Tanapox virus]CAC21304.1 66R protein [Yaba-like disease virus]
MTSKSGHIQIILGPMFSGKSTELIRILKRYQIARYTCFVIKYSKDTRYGKGLVTHDNNSIPAIPVNSLSEINCDKIKADVIGIDEGQFFPDIVEFCERMANDGKIVIVAALDGTFLREPFGNILKLIPCAEYVSKLTAVCMNCFNSASFSKRIGDEQEIEVIGGKDKYQSVCRKCYFKLKINN